MSNKYLGLFIFALLLFTSGYIYQEFYRPATVGGVESSGRIVEVTMRVLKNQWKWEPGILKVQPGDKVRLHIFNEDTYDHGFAIDVFGVNRRLFPLRTTTVEFNASLVGKFNFYCSVPCGDGHYDQIGTILVGEDSKDFTLNFQTQSSEEPVNTSCPNYIPPKTTVTHL